MPVPHLLVHDPRDNVGVVVVEGVAAGDELLGVQLQGDTEFRVVAAHDTPIGHKVALADLADGQDVIKYGEVVGRMVAGRPPRRPRPHAQHEDQALVRAAR